MIHKNGQQGEVILRRVGDGYKNLDSAGVKRKVLAKGRCVVAEGEGHHIHVIDAEPTDAELIQEGERMLLWLKKPAMLHHVPTPATPDAPISLCGEHESEEYAAGLWEVGGVREVDHFAQMERRVVD